MASLNTLFGLFLISGLLSQSIQEPLLPAAERASSEDALVLGSRAFSSAVQNGDGAPSVRISGRIEDARLVPLLTDGGQRQEALQIQGNSKVAALPERVVLKEGPKATANEDQERKDASSSSWPAKYSDHGLLENTLTEEQLATLAAFFHTKATFLLLLNLSLLCVTSATAALLTKPVPPLSQDPRLFSIIPTTLVATIDWVSFGISAGLLLVAFTVARFCVNFYYSCGWVDSQVLGYTAALSFFFQMLTLAPAFNFVLSLQRHIMDLLSACLRYGVRSEDTTPTTLFYLSVVLACIKFIQTLVTYYKMLHIPFYTSFTADMPLPVLRQILYDEHNTGGFLGLVPLFGLGRHVPFLDYRLLHGYNTLSRKEVAAYLSSVGAVSGNLYAAEQRVPVELSDRDQLKFPNTDEASSEISDSEDVGLQLDIDKKTRVRFCCCRCSFMGLIGVATVSSLLNIVQVIFVVTQYVELLRVFADVCPLPSTD